MLIARATPKASKEGKEEERKKNYIQYTCLLQITHMKRKIGLWGAFPLVHFRSRRRSELRREGKGREWEKRRSDVG